MAILRAPTRHPHSPRRGDRRSITSMSERQLQAYLQAREVLRRLRAATADPRRDAAPSGPSA